MSHYYHIASCWIGYLLVVASARGVCWLSVHQDETSAKQALSESQFADSEPNHTAAPIQNALAYVAYQTDRLPPLDVHGSDFQCAVWRALADVKPGEVRHYQEIAYAVGKPRAVRAVASAIGANAIAILIPCHRIIRKDGSLGGYRWGTTLKKKLLNVKHVSSR